jgi:hypothetical protein
MSLVSQAEFARLKKVSRKTVSEWKSEGRIVITGGKVDVEASQKKLLHNSGHRAKGRRAPVTSTAARSAKVTPGLHTRAEEVTTVAAVYADGAVYPNPANLPPAVVDMSTAISGGASDLAFILVQHLGVDQARPMVGQWVQKQRAGWVGGEGLPDAIADDEWPAPPIGYARWSDHPLFTGPAVTDAEWAEAMAEARTGGAA